MNQDGFAYSFYGLIVGVCCSIGILSCTVTPNKRWQEQAISRGCARTNPLTDQFEWIVPTEAEREASGVPHVLISASHGETKDLVEFLTSTNRFVWVKSDGRVICWSSPYKEPVVIENASSE